MAPIIKSHDFTCSQQFPWPSLTDPSSNFLHCGGHFLSRVRYLMVNLGNLSNHLVQSQRSGHLPSGGWVIFARQRSWIRCLHFLSQPISGWTSIGRKLEFTSCRCRRVLWCLTRSWCQTLKGNRGWLQPGVSWDTHGNSAVYQKIILELNGAWTYLSSFFFPKTFI